MIVCDNPRHSLISRRWSIGFDHEPVTDGETPSNGQSYDEFRIMLERNLYNSTECKTPEQNDDSRAAKTFSYVQRWRRNVDFVVEVGPPRSPLITTDFPSSPVAVIHPSSLHISSQPPYDDKAVARLAMPSTPELSTEAIVDRPTYFYDLYDVELDRMIDEASETRSSLSSATSEDDTISVYVPPVTSKATPTKNLKSTFRWLPSRIKYRFLSVVAGRTPRR